MKLPEMIDKISAMKCKENEIGDRFDSGYNRAIDEILDLIDEVLGMRPSNKVDGGNNDQ